MFVILMSCNHKRAMSLQGGKRNIFLEKTPGDVEYVACASKSLIFATYLHRKRLMAPACCHRVENDQCNQLIETYSQTWMTLKHAWMNLIGLGSRNNLMKEYI